MPPGWQPTGHGDRVVAERSGSVPGVAPQEPSEVLVGRARELTAIATAMTAARRGTAQVVHLVGEPGIGKTTLAAGSRLAGSHNEPVGPGPSRDRGLAGRLGAGACRGR